ncbi:hypothetical protein Pint_29519 [Pistacia integerrima]|uniref:Uncharacterized protein n=1 Tax=Pistacia integerrima TaxID=434235 RepID=A0ACC0X4B7_9ROSI|nr:hypothetical protein Pint_29519 [Pistacia integerrima]
MVSEEPISNESTIQISTMSSFSNQNPTFTLNTQPPSATDKQLIALNITAQINEKLTPSTFPQWRAQFEELLIGYDLLNYVEGTFLCPSSTGTTTDKLCKTHWIRQDKLILNYLHAVKTLADEIAIIDHPIFDDDLTLYVLNGLGSDFREIAVPIRAREKSLGFEKLHDLLVGHESYLRRLETATQQMVMTANYTTKGKSSFGGDFSKKSYTPNGHQRNQGQSPAR